MSSTTQQICIEALTLPRKARAEIAHRLLLSLEDQVASPEVERLWKETARQRLARAKAGTTTWRDAKDAIRDARKRLG
jgi:Putative addiction module component